MRFIEAKKQLDTALKRQSTISTKRLGHLLSVMKLVPIKENDDEVEYLKKELRKSKSEINQLKFSVQNARQINDSLREKLHQAQNEANKFKQLLEKRRKKK